LSLSDIKSHLRNVVDREVEVYEDPSQKGHAFLKWVLKNVFEKSEDEFLFTDAPYDFGIDAYFEQDDEVYVIQSKYGVAHSKSAITQFKKDFETFKSTDISKLNIKLHDLKKLVHQGKPVKLIYVTDAEATPEEKEEAERLGIDVFDINTIAQEIWKRNVEPYKGKLGRLKVSKAMTYGDYCIAIISLKNLAEFIDKAKEYIYQSNIRQWLQFRTKVNQNIRETLKKDAKNFFKFNNGITIVCDNFTLVDEQTIQMVSPQIVNGAQTCSAVVASWKENPNLEGEVLGTIMKAVSSEEMKDITRFRNSQNAIKGKDFVSLYDFHKEVKLMLKNFGYFYEIQAGSFALLPSNEQTKYKGDSTYNQYLPANHDHVIPSKDAIQAYIAGFKQNPTDAYGRLYKFMPPNGDNYNYAFPDDLPHDYRLLLFPYLVKEYAKAYLHYGTREAGKEWKAYSTLFFVAVYFKILAHLLNFQSLEPTKVDMDKLEKIFQTFNLNKQILELSDKIVNKFMEDSSVFRKTRVTMKTEEGEKTLFDYPTFFKTHAYKEDFQEILDLIISNIFNQEIKNLKNQMATLL
jgi:hypothetical protein